MESTQVLQIEVAVEDLNLNADVEAYKANAKVFSGGMEKHDVKDYYSTWAEDYEKHLCPGRYNGPAIAADVCSQCFNEVEREQAKILDVAAGTGLLGYELLQRGFCNIHALDPSEGMLELAKKKNIYRKFLCEFLTEHELPVKEGTYDCVTSSGGMGDGHIPCKALYEMIRITKTGGYIVIVMREEYLHDVPEYMNTLEPLMNKLEKQGKWKKIDRVIVQNYAFNKQGLVYKYKKL